MERRESVGRGCLRLVVGCRRDAKLRKRSGRAGGVVPVGQPTRSEVLSASSFGPAEIVPFPLFAGGMGSGRCRTSG